MLLSFTKTASTDTTANFETQNIPSHILLLICISSSCDLIGMPAI